MNVKIEMDLLWVAVRGIPLRRFPYHVGYIVLGDVLQVIALVHDNRHPDQWQHRIREPDSET